MGGGGRARKWNLFSAREKSSPSRKRERKVPYLIGENGESTGPITNVFLFGKGKAADPTLCAEEKTLLSQWPGGLERR